ncbi:DUF1656 domain-containing protein [Hyphomicrobium sp.]|uniref:DUF1656 domain-containing protein n=1 Tax=Hyphomicrobium sp. TaxID=82 RepID=UPI001D7FF30E|nr:DUF1656 domain-containing protein [Hyphomicrobium sp.]MBY0558459.1 DUF1656 domain-containing protein [Hyphomicrobium sp.]
MNPEISIFGVFVPSILVCAIVAYLGMAVLSRCLRYAGVYRFVWHQSLFNLAVFVCLLGLSVLLLTKDY